MSTPTQTWPIAEYVRIEAVLIEARGELARVALSKIAAELGAEIKKRRELERKS